MTTSELRVAGPQQVHVSRWVRAVLVKNPPGALVLRMVVPSLLLSVGGALFVATGPADMGATGTGTPAADALPLVLIGYLIIGQLVVLAGCSWLHLREITSREIGLSYTVFPSRVKLVLGEAAVAMIAGALAGILSALSGFAVYAVVADIEFGAMFSAPAVITAIVRIPLAAGAASLIALTLAVLVRNPFVTILVVVGWASVGEDMLARIPVIGQALHSAAPLSNGYYFSGMTSAPGIADDPWLCFAWLVASGVMLLALSALVESRRKGYV